MARSPSAARASRGLRESFTTDELASILQRARSERAVALTALRLGKLSSKAQGELNAAVARAGFEITGKAIRMPLREQIRGLFERADAQRLGVSAVGREVKGARNAAEVQAAIRELIGDGVLALVADGRTALLTDAGSHVLSEDELAALAALAQQLATLVKASRIARDKPRPTLFRAALEEPLRTFQGLAVQDEPARARSALRAALTAARLEAGLVRVPELVRSLEALHPRRYLLAALDAFASEGQLELRPDSAIGRLAEDDRSRCPTGMDGTPLVYARPLAAATREPL